MSTEHQHSSAHDTLRWGDTQALPGLQNLNTAGGMGRGTTATTKQLAQSHWRWPIVWKAKILINPTFGESESVTFVVTVRITVGSGQGQMTYTKVYTLAPTAGVYSPVVDTEDVPGQDVQWDASVSVQGNATPTTTGEDHLQIGIFTAPLSTEPHAGTHLLDLMRGHEPNHTEWIPPGFREAPLHY
jgi:hypothetical protein